MVLSQCYELRISRLRGLKISYRAHDGWCSHAAIWCRATRESGENAASKPCQRSKPPILNRRMQGMWHQPDSWQEAGSLYTTIHGRYSILRNLWAPLHGRRTTPFYFLFKFWVKHRVLRSNSRQIIRLGAYHKRPSRSGVGYGIFTVSVPLHRNQHLFADRWKTLYQVW